MNTIIALIKLLLLLFSTKRNYINIKNQGEMEEEGHHWPSNVWRMAGWGALFVALGVVLVCAGASPGVLECRPAARPTRGVAVVPDLEPATHEPRCAPRLHKKMDHLKLCFDSDSCDLLFTHKGRASAWCGPGSRSSRCWRGWPRQCASSCVMPLWLGSRPARSTTRRAKGR